MWNNIKGDNKMKIAKLLNADMREEGNVELLHEALFKLPFFKEYKKAPTTDQIESAIKKMQKKYPVQLSYINTAPGANDDEPLLYYSLMVKRTDNHQHVKTVYAMTLFEGLAKVALLMYAFIQKLKSEEAGQ